MDKIVFLDGLRGLAALLVVQFHAGYSKPHNLGAPAVDTFFVLSAFLLTLIFERKAEQLFAQQASLYRWALALGDYFVRRFLRVYPLFAVVATVLALVPSEERARSLRITNPEQLLRVLRFCSDSHQGVLWTLPIEISYYFFIPVIVVVELKLRKLWWLLAVGGYALVFYNGITQWPLRRQHGSPWPHYPTFLCGSLAAIVSTRIPKPKIWTTWQMGALRVLEIAFFVVLLSQLFNGLVFQWIAPNPLPETTHFVAFPVTVLIVCEMLRPGPLSALLEWPLLCYAGKVSFSMYLLHIFVVFQPVVTHQSYYDRFFLLWTLVFLLSSVSFYLIEWPSQRLAGKVGKWIKAKDAADVAAGQVTKPLTSTTRGDASPAVVVLVVEGGGNVGICEAVDLTNGS